MTDQTTLLARPRLSRTLQGILWMVLTGLLFVVVTAIVRYLGSSLPAAEAAFIRYFIGFLILSPSILRLLQNLPERKVLLAFSFRGICHAGGVILWFYAMARIPIAEVTAIGYVTPIFVTLGAALFFGERLRARRILGVVAGFAGVLLIVRPGFSEITIGQLAQIGAAPLFAASYLITKHLTQVASPQSIVAMLTLFCTAALLPFALVDWVNPTWTEVFWLAMTAVFATLGHYTMTRALEAAPISVTQPVTFLQLVWATIIGVAFFSEAVDIWVVLGGLVIVAAATFISHREAQLAKTPVTPPTNAAKL